MVFEQCVPNIKYWKSKARYPVWFTSQIIEKVKNNIYYRYKNESLYHLERFKIMHKEIKNLIKLARKKYIVHIEISINQNAKIDFYTDSKKLSNAEEIS